MLIYSVKRPFFGALRLLIFPIVMDRTVKVEPFPYSAIWWWNSSIMHILNANWIRKERKKTMENALKIHWMIQTFNNMWWCIRILWSIVKYLISYRIIYQIDWMINKKVVSIASPAFGCTWTKNTTRHSIYSNCSFSQSWINRKNQREIRLFEERCCIWMFQSAKLQLREWNWTQWRLTYRIYIFWIQNKIYIFLICKFYRLCFEKKMYKQIWPNSQNFTFLSKLPIFYWVVTMIGCTNFAQWQTGNGILHQNN